VHLIFGALRSI